MPFRIMKKILSALLLLLGIVAAHAQQPFKEFIYAQTDKNFYLAGESLWFKLYNLDENSRLMQGGSRVAYVQLVGDTPNNVQCTVEIDSTATADGVLELPFTIPSGRYKLCAYTRNMLNMGGEALFSKTIHVFNALRYEKQTDKVSLERTVATPDFSVGSSLISTDKAEYGTREAVNIDLSKLPADAIMAVSVVRTDGWRMGDTPITQYAAPATTITGNLMPETESQIIEGTYTSSNGTPAVNANISLRSPVVRYYPGIVDNAGNVQFFTPLMYGVNTIFTGVEPGGSITLKSPFKAPLLDELIPVEISQADRDAVQERSLGIQAARYFGTDSLTRHSSAVEGLHRYELISRYDMENYRRFNSFKETFIEYIYELGTTTTTEGKQRVTMFDEFTGRQNQGNTLVLIDGVAVMNHEDLLNYNPHYCRYIDIYIGHYVFANQEYAGIVNFRTPRGNKMHFALPDNSREQAFCGIQQATSMPLVCRDANAAPMPQQMPDMRHTLYWNPQASAGTLQCFTSDLKGTFVVTVEGITPDGNRIHTTTQFTVK